MPVVESRKTTVTCPKCGKGLLTAVSIMKGQVSHYDCDQCPAYYDADIYHDFPRNEHWWIGRLRNPDFWNYSNETIEKGLAEMDKKRRAGVPDYMGTYPIEKIKDPEPRKPSMNAFDQT